MYLRPELKIIRAPPATTFHESLPRAIYRRVLLGETLYYRCGSLIACVDKLHCPVGKKEPPLYLHI